MACLMEEVAELALSLQGKHVHTPELELREIASIAINWLDMRALEKEKQDDQGRNQ